MKIVSNKSLSHTINGNSLSIQRNTDTDTVSIAFLFQFLFPHSCCLNDDFTFAQLMIVAMMMLMVRINCCDVHVYRYFSLVANYFLPIPRKNYCKNFVDVCRLYLYRRQRNHPAIKNSYLTILHASHLLEYAIVQLFNCSFVPSQQIIYLVQLKSFTNTITTVSLEKWVVAFRLNFWRT